MTRLKLLLMPLRNFWVRHRPWLGDGRVVSNFRRFRFSVLTLKELQHWTSRIGTPKQRPSYRLHLQRRICLRPISGGFTRHNQSRPRFGNHLWCIIGHVSPINFCSHQRLGFDLTRILLLSNLGFLVGFLDRRFLLGAYRLLSLGRQLLYLVHDLRQIAIDRVIAGAFDQ